MPVYPGAIQTRGSALGSAHEFCSITDIGKSIRHNALVRAASRLIGTHAARR